MFHYPVIRFVLYEFCSEILSVAFMKWLLCSFTCVVFTEPSFVYSSYKSGQYKDIGQVFGKVQHVRDQLLYVTVTGSCSKYLTVFTMSLWEEVKGFHWEICVLFAECVCMCRGEKCVECRRESRELADGQRHAACRFNLPASQASNFHIHTSIIQRPALSEC